MKTPATLALVLAFLTAPAAAAEKILKYVYPDGYIVHSDKPVPGAKRESDAAPPPPDPGLLDAGGRVREDASAGRPRDLPDGPAVAPDLKLRTAPR